MRSAGNSRFTLKKSERITEKRVIELLNDKSRNQSVFHYPFILAWAWVPGNTGPSVQVLFNVSKKKIRKAVQRNRAKRLMRALYRQQKPTITNFIQNCPEKEHLAIMFVYIGSKDYEHAFLKNEFALLLEKFYQQIVKAH